MKRLKEKKMSWGKTKYDRHVFDLNYAFLETDIYIYRMKTCNSLIVEWNRLPTSKSNDFLL